jgi:hypothetical protein
MSSKPENPLDPIEQAGGTLDWAILLPDGSGAATASFPLPKDHWIYAGNTRSPMPFRMGKDDPRRADWENRIREAGKYAVRGATMSGRDNDFDPDALIQNLIVGMLGYNTPDGLSEIDDWANPKPPPPIFKP